ncbi:MAG: hypothetical protein E7Z89_06900 [Cyanobacteria bacterium SIG28]|nr:hypothetical protein [Cyanobacteria bacterium SIG28]
MGLGIEKLSEKTINSVAQKYAPTGSVIETSKKAEEKLAKELGKEYAAARVTKADENVKKVEADKIAEAYKAAHGILN